MSSPKGLNIFRFPGLYKWSGAIVDSRFYHKVGNVNFESNRFKTATTIALTRKFTFV